MACRRRSYTLQGLVLRRRLPMQRVLASLSLVLAVAACGASLDGMFGSTPRALEGETTEPIPADDDGEGCTLTQGYWKNHEESWPVSELTLGDETYTQEEALALFR